jgi:hypothetical protein
VELTSVTISSRTFSASFLRKRYLHNLFRVVSSTTLVLEAISNQVRVLVSKQAEGYIKQLFIQYPIEAKSKLVEHTDAVVKGAVEKARGKALNAHHVGDQLKKEFDTFHKAMTSSTKKIEAFKEHAKNAESPEIKEWYT